MDIPHTVSYQGYLTNPSGKPVSDGTYSITLRLYGDANGSQILWQDEMNAQTTNGVFSILLGSGTPLPASAMNQPLWLGVQPNGQDEMRPLTPLTASPYALAIPNNSVTDAKLGVNYVGGIDVNGIPVTTKGSVLNLVGGNNTSLQFDAATNSIIVDAATTTDDGKGGNATTQGLCLAAVEGNVNGLASKNYLTLWQSNSIPNPGNTPITNSAIEDNGTAVIINNAPNSPTPTLKINEDSGCIAWLGHNNVTFSTATPSTGSTGGFNIWTGYGATGGGFGGSIYILEGGSTGTYPGTMMVIGAGEGGTGGGAGGQLMIQAGPGNGAANGGTLCLTAGPANGTGVSGNIDLTAGTIGTTDQGNITMYGDSITMRGGIDFNVLEQPGTVTLYPIRIIVLSKQELAFTITLPTAPP